MKITYDNKETLVSNPVPDINKVTAEDMNEIKSSVNYLYDVLGWVEYRDTLNTVDNKQTILASQETLFTIDGNQSILMQAPKDNALWVNNKINPIKVGDAYTVRLDFEASITNSDGFFDIGLFVGGPVGYAFKNTFRFQKGNNVTHNFSFTALIYTLETFKTNGGQFLVNASHEMSIWNKRVIINKTHDGR